MIRLPLIEQANHDIFFSEESYYTDEDIELEGLGEISDIINDKIMNEILKMHSTREQLSSGWISYENFDEEDSNYYPNSGYPILKEFFLMGESGIMEEECNSEQKLIQEKWENNFKRIMKKNQNSQRKIFQDDDEMVEFIHNCEKFYNKTTEEHIKEHVRRNFEGNVDERRWYRFAKYLMEKGTLF